MKKIWFAIVLAVCASLWFLGPKSIAGSFGGADGLENASLDELIDAKKIYVFIQKGCPHCWAAEKYLKEKHPNLDLEMKDIAVSENRKLFAACGAKFKLNKYTMGTPLFCMGDNYILGWDTEAEGQFETYLKDFLSKE